MEKNNGKIAIAIVAMFVVALSVIGFTYAYFVANVEGNDKVNVDVTAGILEVEYKNNTGNTVLAKNVVPGWMSDGLHYYDATVYGTNEEGSTYTAQMATSKETIPAGVDFNDGITDPYKFTVGGTTRNTGDAEYVIILNSISKLNVAEADKANFRYLLCEGSCPVWDNTDSDADDDDEVEVFNETAYNTLKADAKVIGAGSLFANTDTNVDNDNTEVTLKVISDVQTAGKQTTNSYELMVYYLETGAAQASKGATISADIEIIGVQKVGNDYVDGNGTIIPIPTNLK